MKKMFSLIALCLVGMQAWGQMGIAHGTCGADGDGSDLTWILTDDGTLTISGVGDMADYAYGTAIPPWDSFNMRIKTVIIEPGVTSIGDQAFSDYGVESVSIANSVKSIGSSAFFNCTSLVSVTMEEGLTTIKDAAFFMCNNLTSLTIPASVTSIEEGAFCYCTSLTSVTIPKGVTSIKEMTFSHCTSLTSMAIPASVASIESSAFSTCTSLTSITIPRTVTSIGNLAFGDCTGLVELTCEATVPPTLGLSVFIEVNPDITLYVPAGSIEQYRTAEGWKEFTNFQAITDTGLDDTPILGERITVKGEEVFLNVINMPEVQVFDMNGRCVLRTMETRFTLPQAGIYLVKVGDECVKIVR